MGGRRLGGGRPGAPLCAGETDGVRTGPPTGALAVAGGDGEGWAWTGRRARPHATGVAGPHRRALWELPSA